MLSELTIKNFALIDEMRIEYGSGLNIITGETGSGKSIMIDALSLALGKKGSRTMVRQGQKRAIIEAVFHCEDAELSQLLKQFDLEEDEPLVLSREITSDGRSISRVNGRTINQSDLKELTAQIITIHGQNEYEQLLSSSNQLRLLDGFAKDELESLLTDYHADYMQKTELEKKILSINEDMDAAKIERELDLLRYEIEEIQSVNIRKNEREEIKEQLLLLENSEKIKQNTEFVYQSLYGEKDSLLDILSTAMDRLENISDFLPEAQPWIQVLNDSYYAIEDIVHEMKNLDFEEDTTQAIDELHTRLDKINLLYRKYGKSYDEVMAYFEAAKKRKDTILSRDELAAQYRVELEKLDKRLLQKAEKLTTARKQIAQRLKTEIHSELLSLDMKNVQFEIDFQQIHFTRKGRDQIEFLVSFNPGESVRPLAQIASGGEISRFMLAFKTVVAKSDNLFTLIFDEIDTGVSGIAAQKIGTKLKEISRFRQVICITHLPQIAGFADRHFVVEKIQKADHTGTQVRSLSSEERIVELAKMMSGTMITQNTLETAKDMIFKNSEQ